MEYCISKNQKDTSISIIRFISMILIIICHFMQYFDCELMWWFNVGVQIFLCVSGYLYGAKKIDTIPFFKRTFSKILISVYVVLVPVLAILFVSDKIGTVQLLKTLFFKVYAPGGEHLWFIPTILLCYFITPFLSEYYKDFSNKSHGIKTIFLLIVIYIVLTNLVPYFNPAWISCYIIGFVIRKKGDELKKTTVLILILAVIFNCVQILLDYFVDINIPAYITENFISYSTFKSYSHTLLGISLFLILKRIFKGAKPRKIWDLSDRYSYQVYLVHQFLILGPLSLMNITRYKIVDITIILLLVIVLAVLVKQIATYVDNVIKKFSKNRL